MPDTFRCELLPDRDRVVVRPVGEVDLATAPAFEQRVSEAAGAGFASIVIDLRDVTFLDSSGLRVLLAAHVAGQDGSPALEVVRARPEVHRVVELTGLDGVFRWVEPRDP
ncbi:MAG: STAS domain-containing protein [Solirubrobacterales bacterium]|nr:STAS domain-containing protein [Solirubrobacterales bacterium]